VPLQVPRCRRLVQVGSREYPLFVPTENGLAKQCVCVCAYRSCLRARFHHCGPVSRSVRPVGRVHHDLGSTDAGRHDGETADGQSLARSLESGRRSSGPSAVEFAHARNANGPGATTDDGRKPCFRDAAGWLSLADAAARAFDDDFDADGVAFSVSQPVPATAAATATTGSSGLEAADDEPRARLVRAGRQRPHANTQPFDTGATGRSDSSVFRRPAACHGLPDVAVSEQHAWGESWELPCVYGGASPDGLYWATHGPSRSDTFSHILNLRL